MSFYGNNSLLSRIKFPIFTGIWAVNSNGNWSNPANWIGGVPPNDIYHLADFSKVNLTANRIVTVDGVYTVGGMNIGDSDSSNASVLTYTFDQGQLIFSNPLGVMNVNLSLGGSTAERRVLFITQLVSADSVTFTQSNSVSGGIGIISLQNTNTFTGDITIGQAATLLINNGAALGSNNRSVTLQSGATLRLEGGITVAPKTLIHNGGTLGYLRNISGNNTWTGNINVNAANSRIRSDSGLLTISGNISLTTNVGLIFETASSTANITVSGLISGNSVALTMSNVFNDTSVLTLSNPNNSYVGRTTISRGILRISSLKNINNDSSIGSGVNSILLGGIGNNNSTLEYTGSGDTTNRQIAIGATFSGNMSARILNNGSGALVFSSSNFNIINEAATAAVSRTLILGGSNTNDNAIVGIIQNPPNVTVSLIKQDIGNWILSGANAYTGTTSILSGTLRVSGAAINSATASKVTRADFTNTTLTVTFGTSPAAGETYRLFPGSTVQTYNTVTLSGTGVTGRTATYNSVNSTLTIA